MKKKIGLGLVAILLVASAVVFANSNTTIKTANTCPDRPGCICSKNATALTAKPTALTDKKESCPDFPGCICSK